MIDDRAQLKQNTTTAALVVVGVVALALAVVHVPWLALLPLVVVAAGAVLVRPEPFLLFLISAIPLAEIPTDLAPQSHLGSVRDILLLLIVVACAIRVCQVRRIELPRSPITIATIAFTIVVVFYMPFGPSPIQAITGAKALAWSGAAYFAVAYLMRTRAQLRTFCIGMTLAALAMGLYGLFAFLGPQDLFPYDPLSTGNQIADGPTRLHFSPFTYFFVEVIPLLWLTATSMARRRLVQFGVLAISALAIGLVALSQLRQAWLGLLAAVVVCAVWSRRRLAIAAAAFAGLGAALLVSPDSIITRLVNTGSSNDIGFTGRVAEAQSVWLPLLSQHPFGLGTGTFSSSAAAYWQPILGSFTFAYTTRGVTHNGYFEVMAEVGILGFLVYLWLILAVFVQVFRNRKVLRDPLARSVNTVILAQLVVYCVINFFTPAAILFPVNAYFFIFAGIAAVLPHLDRGRVTDPVEHG